MVEDEELATLPPPTLDLEIEPVVRPVPPIIGRFAVTGVLETSADVVWYEGHFDGTSVAIKVPSGPTAPATIEDLERVERIDVTHPNIIRVVDSGRTPDGAPFIAFERPPGATLEEVISQRKLTPSEAITLGMQVLHALEVAHSAGLVHRRLSPRTVFLGDDGVARIMGLIRGGHSSDASTSFVAPEQLQGRAEVDARADVWAVGALMCAALTGRSPFERASRLATEVATLIEPAPTVRSLDEAVPSALAAVIERALLVSVSSRWPTAGAFARALAALGPEQPITNIRPTTAADDPGPRAIALLLASGVTDASLIAAGVRRADGHPIELASNRVFAHFEASAGSMDALNRALDVALDLRFAVDTLVLVARATCPAGPGVPDDLIEAVGGCLGGAGPGVTVDRVTAELLGPVCEKASVDGDLFDVQARRTSDQPLQSTSGAPFGGDTSVTTRVTDAWHASCEHRRPQRLTLDCAPAAAGRWAWDAECVLRDALPDATVVVGRAHSTNFSMFASLVADLPDDRSTPTDPVASSFVHELMRRQPSPSPALAAARQSPRRMADSMAASLESLLVGLTAAGPVALILEGTADDASGTIISRLLAVDSGALLVVDVQEADLMPTIDPRLPARLSRLSAGTRALADTLAVIGRPASWFELSSLGTIDLQYKLRLLADAGLLDVRSSRRETRLSPAVGPALLGAMTTQRRRSLYDVWAQRLARDVRATAAEVASQFVASGHADRAGTYFADAALEAASFGDAKRTLLYAEEALARGLTTPLQVRLRIECSRALAQLGRIDEQLAMADWAVAHAADDRARAEAAIARSLAFTHDDRTDDGAIDTAKAVELARSTDDPRLLVTALLAQADRAVSIDQLDVSRAALAEALALDLSPHERADVAALRGRWADAMGDLAVRKVAFVDALATAREIQDHRGAAEALARLAEVYNRVGDYDAAAAALADAAQLGGRVGARRLRGYALANLGYALGMLTKLEPALTAVHEASLIAHALGDVRLAVYSALYRVRARSVATLPVADEADLVADDAFANRLDEARALALTLGARARLVSGDVAGATDRIRAAMDLVDQLGGLEEDELEVYQVASMVFRAAGDEDGAAHTMLRGRKRLEMMLGGISDAALAAAFARTHGGRLSRSESAR